MNIEIYLYFMSLRRRLFLNQNCFIYWLYSCRSRYELVEDLFVKFSFEISCSFLISFVKHLNMIMFVKLTWLIKKFARYVELFNLMRLIFCQWLNVTYLYSKYKRNIILFDNRYTYTLFLYTYTLLFIHIHSIFDTHTLVLSN